MELQPSVDGGTCLLELRLTWTPHMPSSFEKLLIILEQNWYRFFLYLCIFHLSLIHYGYITLKQLSKHNLSLLKNWFIPHYFKFIEA